MILVAFSHRCGLQLPSSSLWCSRSRWGPFQLHQLGLQFTKTLVMPSGYQGHKRANWKQITHTHTCGHIYTCNHAHRRVNPHAGHYTHRDTRTQYHTLNYSDPHINTLTQCATHTCTLCLSEAPPSPQRKAPQGEGKGVSSLFLMKSMWKTPHTGNEWGDRELEGQREWESSTSINVAFLSV